MHRYAQVDANNICIAVSELSGEVDAFNMIPLPDVTSGAVIGHRYENGQWVEVPQEPQLERIEDISDRQFYQNLASKGIITESEAEDAVGPGIIPNAMAALISSLPIEQQFPARMLIRGATRFERNHPVAELIRNLYGWTPEETDIFWKEAALL